MHAPLDQARLAELLPGSWSIVATNFPMWLSGKRSHPRFSYALVSADPLVLGDDVSYLDADGKDRHILGRDVLRGDEFVWRGRGALGVIASRWSVAGCSDDGEVVAIRFSKSLATPAGVDIIVREGANQPEVRAVVANASEQFGLTPEGLGSLSWLGVDRRG